MTTSEQAAVAARHAHRGAAPTVGSRVRERSYRVVGADAPTLRRCIDLLGPRADGSTRGASAYTRWDVRWSYVPRSRDGAFAAVAVRVDCDITMTLPRWDPPAAASPALVALFSSALAELRAHEQGHVAIARATARDVADAVAAATACASAAGLRRLVERQVLAVVARRRAEERRYDEEHGARHDPASALARLASASAAPLVERATHAPVGERVCLPGDAAAMRSVNGGPCARCIA